MAVRALLAVAGLLAVTLHPVRGGPGDPQSRSMIPQGIITADMFKNNRQDAARKLALPPAVQMGSGKFRRSLDVDYEPWAAIPTDQLFRRSSEEITFHDLFNMGAAAPKNPYIVYAAERSKSEKSPVPNLVNSTYGLSSFRAMSSKIDAANPSKKIEISGSSETDRVSKNKTLEDTVKPFRYRKRNIHSQTAKQDSDISTKWTSDERKAVPEDSKIAEDKFPLTKSQLFDLFNDSRPDDFDNNFEISSEIKLSRASNSTSLEERNSIAVDSKPLIVKLIPVESSIGIQTLHNESSQKTQVQSNDTDTATPSIKRATPTVLIPKTPFGHHDLTWKGYSKAEKYYFTGNQFPKQASVLKREITTTKAKPITNWSEMRGKVSTNGNSDGIQIVNPLPPAGNKLKTFSFAKPTSYSRPIYFTDAQTLPLSLAPPVPPIMSVSPSTDPKQASFHTFNNMAHAGIPLNHLNIMRVPGQNHLFPNHNPRTQGFRPAGWLSGSQFSITSQPAHPGLYFIDPARRLRSTHPRINAIPGNIPNRFRTPLHPPPIVMKSETEAPGSVSKNQSGTPPKLPNVPESPLQPGAPPSLIQRPPGLPTSLRNQLSGQRPRQKRRPAHSNPNSNQSAGPWSNFIQRLTGLRSAPTTPPATRLAHRLPDPPISFANEVPVGLKPPSIENTPDTSESQEIEEFSGVIKLIPNFQGSFGNHPTAFHPLTQTIVEKSPQLFHGQQTGQLIHVMQNHPGTFITEGNELQLVPINGVRTVPGVFQYNENSQAESRSSKETSSLDESETLKAQRILTPALIVRRPKTNSSKRAAKRQQLPFATPIHSSTQQQMILYPMISPYAYPSHQLLRVVRSEPETAKSIGVSNEPEYITQQVLTQPQFVLQPQYAVMM